MKKFVIKFSGILLFSLMVFSHAYAREASGPSSNHSASQQVEPNENHTDLLTTTTKCSSTPTVGSACKASCYVADGEFCTNYKCKNSVYQKGEGGTLVKGKCKS